MARRHRHRPGLAHRPDGDHNALTVFVVVLLGNTISLLAYLCVLAAVSRSIDSLGHGQPLSPIDAYKAVGRRLRPLSGVAAWIVLVVGLLLIPVVTAPLALVYAVRRAFAVHVVMVEHESIRGALRRSRELVQGRWWPVALLLALVAGIGAVTGPMVGITILVVSDGTAFWLINLIAGLVYAATIPYVALVVAYQYLDLSIRADSDDERQPAPIP